MYYSCHCIKRNGLQHDCRRTGCGGEPGCMVLPDPMCAPSQLARARGLADPAPLAPHLHGQGSSGGTAGSGGSSGASGGGKRFIVCELKSIDTPGFQGGGSQAGQGACCCKCPKNNSPCPASQAKPPTPAPPAVASGSKNCACQVPIAVPVSTKTSGRQCPCHGKNNKQNNNATDKRAVFECDQKLIDSIIARFDSKEVKKNIQTVGPGGRPRKESRAVAQEQPCTRPDCQHWNPPPPCIWDLPCKADCFETPPGIQPGRSPLNYKCSIPSK